MVWETSWVERFQLCFGMLPSNFTKGSLCRYSCFITLLRKVPCYMYMNVYDWHKKHEDCDYWCTDYTNRISQWLEKVQWLYRYIHHVCHWTHMYIAAHIQAPCRFAYSMCSRSVHACGICVGGLLVQHTRACTPHCSYPVHAFLLNNSSKLEVCVGGVALVINKCKGSIHALFPLYLACSRSW